MVRKTLFCVCRLHQQTSENKNNNNWSIQKNKSFSCYCISSKNFFVVVAVVVDIINDNYAVNDGESRKYPESYRKEKRKNSVATARRNLHQTATADGLPTPTAKRYRYHNRCCYSCCQSFSVPDLSQPAPNYIDIINAVTNKWHQRWWRFQVW